MADAVHKAFILNHYTAWWALCLRGNRKPDPNVVYTVDEGAEPPQNMGLTSTNKVLSKWNKIAKLARAKEKASKAHSQRKR